MRFCWFVLALSTACVSAQETLKLSVANNVVPDVRILTPGNGERLKHRGEVRTRYGK